MSQSSTKGEKITAVVSAIVAMVILAVGVTAQQNRFGSRHSIYQLESDFRFQLEKAFKYDIKEREHRIDQLNQVITRWNNSERKDSDRELLSEWLMESIIRTMPGTTQALPALPEFGKTAAISLAGIPADMPSTEENYAIESNYETKDYNENEDFKNPFPVNQEVANFSEETNITSINAESSREKIEELEATNQVINAVLAERPSSETISAQKADAPRLQARVNYTELTTRIDGYHEDIAEIESKIATIHDLNIRETSFIIDQIDGLTRRYRFLKLYYDSLTSLEKTSVPEPQDINPYLMELAKQIKKLGSGEPYDFLSDFESAGSTDAEELLERLETIANRAK